MNSVPPILQRIRDKWVKYDRREITVKPQPVVGIRQEATASFEITPDDPLVAHFLRSSGVVDIHTIQIDSPALTAMRAQGVQLVVPLVSRDELIGLLALGPRMSEQQYSSDDRGLLNTLAIQAAPAVRVAQMIHEQQAAIRERERLNQELRIARLIQRTLLPRDLPAFPGWQLAAYYQPAWEVGGDFYDFLSFEDGRLGIIIGDVTDKGIPAALVMATTRSMLRSLAQGKDSPGAVLARVNDMLYQDIPAKMFVTCLYAILEPTSGKLMYANAGHDLPYMWHNGSVAELRATGMPLGLMPGKLYEEKETILAPGERVLFYSDGLVEAHNPEREMFGFLRLETLLRELAQAQDTSVIDYLLNELAIFTGGDWEQEDDVTMVSLQRSETYAIRDGISGSPMQTDAAILIEEARITDKTTWLTLDEWTIPSEPGNERQAIEHVARAVQPLHLSTKRLEQLKTAVAEATMNAMEHGNHYQSEKPVVLSVLTAGETLSVRITDLGGTRLLTSDHVVPDLEAKLAELQSPRGWGLFLIKNMVDDMHIYEDATHHTIELIMRLATEE